MSAEEFTPAELETIATDAEAVSTLVGEWIDDWYCVAWESGLPYNSCSPEDRIHSAPCGPWRRRLTAAEVPR